MKKMFLSSSFADSVNSFKNFAGMNLENKSVTFIPTASMVEEVTHHVDLAKEAFHNLGMNIFELDISKESREDIIQNLKNNDFIYISGGNTFFLLQELKKKSLDKVIIQEVNNGKMYIGESAGTIIMAPNIEYIYLLDNKEKAPELGSYQGLNEINFYPVPHLQNDYLGGEVEQIIKKYQNKIELLPITDNQVILVDGEKISVI
ncbi:Type 1 glutamine amidotransferase-like domain-containing protein [Paenibacillus sp. N3/727]|uniref:Type 1 glutamine amidotransferase-like domain-containing protein n=1 Tax=Paenibacillus sp. N3/727 TaxID=2925845 RepID=UPI001F53261D|nr:Type 1 glutamine amidotransferase-like domain-containing protein [Paenibacillus sp. N3/727]UNK21136.1 Type 1 glutamine amidotransferase-like domain-containing protein [Paenibacillus sp. N3/727]